MMTDRKCRERERCTHSSRSNLHGHSLCDEVEHTQNDPENCHLLVGHTNVKCSPPQAGANERG